MADTTKVGKKKRVFISATDYEVEEIGYDGDGTVLASGTPFVLMSESGGMQKVMTPYGQRTIDKWDERIELSPSLFSEINKCFKHVEAHDKINKDANRKTVAQNIAEFSKVIGIKKELIRL